MAKIAFFETDEKQEEYFKNNLHDVDIKFSEFTLEPEREYDNQLFDAEAISVFAFSQLKREVLEKFSNLKFISTRSTGFDHIDLDYCKDNNIVVSNVPAYGVHSVAEHTFALILALSQKIVPSVERTRKGDFTLEGLRGFELYGKTLGVVGVGNIGKVVAQIGLGIGMNVIAYNRHDDEELKNAGVEFMDLDSLLGKADIITLHLPYNKETHHVINSENISKIKKGAIFINNARGGLVETQAIYDALNKEIISAAGLDVLEEECGIREEGELLSTKFLETCDLKTQLLDHMLLNREDVLITPHNAFNSNEAVEEIMRITIENIHAYLSGNPQNTVDK
jgi:D-lactate dehydrogenase